MNREPVCPVCGFPDAFTGIYIPGNACEACGFIDKKSKLKRIALANYAHMVWSEWMEYLFSKCQLNADGTVTIPKELVDRWVTQMNTSYSELSESEKRSDLKEADRILSIVE